METVKEPKVKEKAKLKQAAPKANEKTQEKPKTPNKTPKTEKLTGWSIAREMLSAGKPEKEIRAAIHDHLAKTTDPKIALEFYVQRMSYRMLFRAKRAAKKGAKEKKNAA
jgi:hypothetical protein